MVGKWTVAFTLFFPCVLLVPCIASPPPSLARTSSTQAVTVISHTMTDAIPQNDCDTPTSVYTFQTTNSIVYSWTYVSGARSGDHVQWDWYQPNGVLYVTSTFTLTYTGYVCFWGGIYIAGQPPATTPGNWSVRVSYNGTLIVTENFTIGSVSSAPPPWTTSYYITPTVNTDTEFNLGCNLGSRDFNLPGAQDDVVILDFGQPWQQTQGGQVVYGTILPFTGTFASCSAIADAAFNFAAGYYTCSDSDSQLHLVIGTNNYGHIYVTAKHGIAWAEMVNAVVSQITQAGLRSQVEVDGGSDMELAWNNPSVTMDWLNGYESVGGQYLFDFGDAPGCPQSGTTNISKACPIKDVAWTWYQEDVWYISWGSPSALPLPEIYRTDGSLAREWQQLSLYSYLAHGVSMTIFGSLTQHQACQVRGCDPSVNNTQDQGWSQLYDALNSDSRTAQVLYWSTDIK